MRNKKALLHTSLLEKDYVSAYRHVVVNIVLFFATCMYTVVDKRCKVYASTKDQSNGTHAEDQYRDKMYVQRTNHMGVWGHNACTKE